MKTYVAVIRRVGLEFAISFPDIPGCEAGGATMEEARVHAARALAVHLERLIEAGDAIPAPSSLKEIISDPQWKDADIDAIIPAVRPVARTDAQKGSGLPPWPSPSSRGSWPPSAQRRH